MQVKKQPELDEKNNNVNVLGLKNVISQFTWELCSWWRRRRQMKMWEKTL